MTLWYPDKRARGTSCRNDISGDELFDLAARLVSIDSINPDLVPGSRGEGEIGAFVAEWAQGRTLEVHVEETGLPGQAERHCHGARERRRQDSDAQRPHGHRRGGREWKTRFGRPSAAAGSAAEGPWTPSPPLPRS